MNRLNKPQKDKVTQFRTITGASEKAALECLKHGEWVTEAAIDYYYSSGLAAATSLDTKSLENLFLKYKDPQEEYITAEGICKFCEDLGVEPADVVMLVIAHHMNAAVMGEFKRDEWITGCTKMAVDSLDKLKKKLPELRAELRDDNKFRDIYNFAYMFSREKGQKCVQLETALAMWQLILSGDRHWPLIEDWCAFLQTSHANRAISKDTWEQLLDFMKQIKPDFSNFDENGAWPYLLDEFVEFVKERRGAMAT